MRRAAGLVLIAVLAAPMLAIAPALIVDRGPDGASRTSAFPAALVLLDPLAWRCVRNGVAVAAVVAIGATAAGAGLGLILGRRRFWGRGPLGLLAVAPLAAGPVWTTPGVLAWVGGGSGWDWLAARSFVGQPGDDWGRFFALAWAEAIPLVPVAILATRAALLRVDPAWADAARVVGAGRFRVWRDSTWPVLRPMLARVAASAFAWTLVEPGGPTILGLRRTLAVVLADAAMRHDEANRAAGLGALAIGLAIVVWAGLCRWGGPVAAAGRFEPGPIPRAGVRVGGLAALILVAWVVVGLGPIAATARRLADAALGGGPSSVAGLRSIAAGWLAPEMLGWAANSATTAALAVGLNLAVLSLLSSGGRWAGWLAAAPALAVAAGAATIPALLASWGAATYAPALRDALGMIGLELSPGRSPGFLLVAVLAVARMPMLAWAGGKADAGSPAAVDAALLAGSSARSAARLAGSRAGGVALGPVAVAWAWAATDLAAAWVLTPLAERQTLAAAALHLVADQGGPVDPRLLGLFATMIAIRFLALLFALTDRRRSRPAGDWIVAP